MLTPEERKLRARIGALRLHATHDPRQTTSEARRAFLRRFELEVDPNGDLDPAERERRAVYARRAYFAGLSYKSARTRARKSRSPAEAVPV